MAYRVHRFEMDMKRDGRELEEFLNSLTGDVVSVIPNVATPSLKWIYGLRRSVDFVLVIERTSSEAAHPEAPARSRSEQP